MRGRSVRPTWPRFQGPNRKLSADVHMTVHPAAVLAQAWCRCRSATSSGGCAGRLTRRADCISWSQLPRCNTATLRAWLPCAGKKQHAGREQEQLPQSVLSAALLAACAFRKCRSDCTCAPRYRGSHEGRCILQRWSWVAQLIHEVDVVPSPPLFRIGYGRSIRAEVAAVSVVTRHVKGGRVWCGGGP